MEQREQRRVLVGFDRLGRRLFSAVDVDTAITRRTITTLLILWGVTWLPTALLSIWEGSFYDGTIYSFLLNSDAQARLLLSLPIALLSRPVIRAGCDVVTTYASRNLVPEHQLADHWLPAVERAKSLETARWVMAMLIVVVILMTLRVVLDAATIVTGEERLWYAYLGPDGPSFTWAGFWYYLIAVPVYQYVTLRAFWLYLVWVWQLWKLARTDLKITAVHGDRMGGLSILVDGQFGFLMFFVSVTSTIAGVLAFEVMDKQITFEAARMDMILGVLLALILLLLPMFLFVNDLTDERRRSLIDYATLSSKYGQKFHQRWVEGSNRGEDDDEVDASFIADFNSVYEIATSIKPVPITLRNVIMAFLLLSAPFIMVLLTQFSPNQLIGRVIEMLS